MNHNDGIYPVVQVAVCKAMPGIVNNVIAPYFRVVALHLALLAFRFLYPLELDHPYELLRVVRIFLVDGFKEGAV